MPIPTRYYANKFNRGEVDPLAIARDDVDKVKNSGTLVENFMPVRLGPMQYRPGLEHLGSTAGEAHFVPFVAGIDDTALLEFTNNLLRIWIDDALVARSSVTTSITNGSFATDLTGWTDDDDLGATSAWATGGYMSLAGNETASAIRYQTLTTQTGQPHGIRIVIAEAPVYVQIGTSGASSEEIFGGTLKPGTHCLKFTPDANVTLTFSNNKKYRALVESVSFDATGTLTIPTSVATAQLSMLRATQSADVMFFTYDDAENGFVIERRGTESWSVVDYRCDDGPFNVINTTDITLTPSALSGNPTLTASKTLFSADDVGRLFKVASSGQTVTVSITAEDTGTNSILVTGTGSSRVFNIQITGLTGLGSTVTLQRSTDDASWVDVESYTTNQAKTFDDGFDNALLYYRLFCKTGDYVAGTLVCVLTFSGGSIEGVCRVTSFTSDTEVTVQVLQDFGATDASRDWYAGTWSIGTGYPSACGLYEGRLWFGGKGKTWGSVSDAYYSFDNSVEGDSAAIQRTIGFGPVDSIEWFLPLNRLIMGTVTDEIAVRSDSFGTVLTPFNTNLRPGSSQGAAPIEPLRADSRGYFVQRSLQRLYELDYSANQDIHEALDLTILNPSICQAGIARVAYTAQPEPRLYCVLNDGSMRVLLMDRTENVRAWSRFTTDGTIEDVVVLPSTGEDRVYMVVNRTGGRYLEKLALFSEAVGGTLSKHFDSFVVYSSPGTTLTGLSHVEGKTVGIWGDGQFRGTAVVSGGQVTAPGSYSQVVAGIRHTAKYRTAKLSHFVQDSVLTMMRRVVNVGFVLKNYWPGSLRVGVNDATLQDFPVMEDGTQLDTTATLAEYDESPFPFNGTGDTDTRIYLEATNPVTVLALTYGVEVQEDGDKTNRQG